MIKEIKYNRTVKNFMEMLYSLSRTRDMNETVYWYDDGDDIPLFYLSSENHLTIRTELFELTKKDFGLTSYEIAVIINKYIIGGEDDSLTILNDTNTIFKVENNKFIQC